MVGYYRDPEKTARRSIRRLGAQRPTSASSTLTQFRIVDRKKELIISSSGRTSRL